MTGTKAMLLAGGAVLAAAVTGARSGPQQPRAGAWYARLRKPDWTPPGPAIGIAWTLLEGLLWYSGTRLLRARPGAARDVALTGWAGTIAGLATYPWVLFRARRLDAGLAASSAMLASAVATAAAGRRADPKAAAATLPLLAWLGFATLLSEELLRRNGPR